MDQSDIPSTGAPASPPAAPSTPADVTHHAPAHHHHPRKKHKAHIQHRIRGRIRLKVPHAQMNPEILETYREAFSAIPGITQLETRAETGSIVICYDPNREREFEHHFNLATDQHLDMPERADPRRPDGEVDKLANQIEAEAEYLAKHSKLAASTVEFCKALDREMKLATGNNVDLKIVLAGGLAVLTFIEIGAHAATPMWVTLALFSLNHFVELHTDHAAELAAKKEAAAQT